uniref:TIL domain-containing protein n=1 Tax=Anopheles gambiae TaxID=7165 RepID=A0A903XWX9_ANOGA
MLRPLAILLVAVLYLQLLVVEAKTSSLITRRPICKTNEVYSTCSKCGNLICNTLISNCPQTCQSGCFCKSGFARKGNVCVPAAFELRCVTGERVYCSKLSYLVKC